MPIITLEQMREIASQETSETLVPSERVPTREEKIEYIRKQNEYMEKVIAEERSTMETSKLLDDLLNKRIDLTDIYDFEDEEEIPHISTIAELKRHDASSVVDSKYFPRSLNSESNLGISISCLRGKVNSNTGVTPQGYGDTLRKDGRRYVRWNGEDHWVDETLVRVATRRAKATTENWKALDDAIKGEGGEDVALAWDTMLRSPADWFFRKEVLVMFEHRIYQHPLYNMFIPCFKVAINCTTPPKTKTEIVLSGTKRNDLQRRRYACLVSVIARYPYIGEEIARLDAEGIEPSKEFKNIVDKAVEDTYYVDMHGIKSTFASMIKDRPAWAEHCQMEYGLDRKVVEVIVGRAYRAKARKLNLAGSNFVGNMNGKIIDTSKVYAIMTGEATERNPMGWGPDC